MFSRLKRWIQNWQIPVRVAVLLFLSGLGCFLIKVTFFSPCINQACIAKDEGFSSSLLTVGGLLVAIIALLPAFWVESRVKDAKEEVRRQITEDIRKEIVNLATAHSLLLRAHRDTQPDHLLEYEGYVQQAISLDPTIKEQEYPLLGKGFARTALELNAGTYDTRPGTSLMSNPIFPSDTLYPSPTLYPIDLKTSVQKAIFYLEESIPYIETAKDYDRMFYIDLACMYALDPGRTDRFADVKLLIEKIVNHDDTFAQDDLAHFVVLTALVQACAGNLTKIGRIGKIVGANLPLEEQDFLKVIQKIAPASLGHYLQGYAIKKTDGYIHYIKISTAEINGKNTVVTAFSYRESIQKFDSFIADQETIPLEELYDRISKKFHLIAFKDD